MKKLVLLSGLLAVLVLAFFYFYKSPSQIYFADTTAPQAEEKMILLYPESGDVSFKLRSDDSFTLATTSPTEIPNGAIIHTDIGRASVLLPDNSSVTLAENTEITINYSPTKTSMYQSFGTTYHRVEKLITGASYQVQTAGTLAAVRGTKFIVSYDKKQKKTKVAVTESKVEVTTITKATTTEAHEEEVAMVETGRTVTIDTEHKVKTKEGKLSAIAERAIADDDEIAKVVEREKKGDSDLNTIKKEEKEKKLNKEEVRKEIKRVLFKDDGKRENKEKKSDGEKKELDNEKKTEANNDSTKTPVQNTETVVRVKAPVVAMDEEKFFTQFEPLFIKYFYLDETDTTCLLTATPDERVKIVHEFADTHGYPFTKDTLPSFARAISDYCASKDAQVKSKLQARFDDEYPF